MSTRELERALASWRSGEPPDFGRELSVEEALQRRNEGNIPDEEDRSLRLVLVVDEQPLEQKRLRYEPDFHKAPEWRREGSRPVNVVPLRDRHSPPPTAQPWWDNPRVQTLEKEWQATGVVAGMRIEAEYRSFVFKTVIALQDAGEPISPRTVGDSVSRWLSPEDARKVRDSLQAEGPGM